MLAYEIKLNGKKKVLAGIEDWDVLHAIISARRGRDEESGDDIELSVGALAQPKIDHQYEHVRWGRWRLSVEDELTIHLVEVSQADPPKKRYRSDREVQEDPFTQEEIDQMEREDYLRLKKKFEKADKN